MKDDSKKKLRSSFDDILGYDLPDEVPGVDETPVLPKISQPKETSKAISARTKANKIMDKLLRFYLSEEIIKEQEYITAKADLDKAALSMLIKQMQNSEKAIDALMDTIDEGDVSPRMFEVLSDLQRTMLDIIKNQTMYMVSTEEHIKKVARDLDVYQNKSSSNKKIGNGGIKSRGTKDLMKALQQINNDDVTDVESSEDEE